MKIRPVGAELIHADGQTDRHDKTNGLFAILRNAPKSVTHRSNKILVSPAAYEKVALSRFGYFLTSGVVNNLWKNKNIKMDVS
jgi:hypothetical protein